MKICFAPTAGRRQRRNDLFVKTPAALVALVFTTLAGFALGAGSDRLSVGLAVVDITPPLGGKRVGYAEPLPSDGVNHPITARVMVLESGETSVAIVTWDLCVATSSWLHRQMPELGIDRLLLLNTHTHSGPDLDQKDFPTKENQLRATVEHKVLAALKEAKQNLFPAYLAAGEGSIQLGYNRLVRQPEGHAITHFENPERIPYGPVDPTVGVLRVTDEQGKVRAVLVNYACHPVVLGPPNRKLSADFPGAMRQEVETELGGGVVCFFMQGAAGDINPLMLARSGDPAQDLPLVETMGKTLAGEVLSVLEHMKSVQGKSEPLSIATKTLIVENRWETARSTNPPQRADAAESKPEIPLSVTTLLLNSEIGFIAMPGEPFHQFQIDWRRKAGLPHAFFLGYSAQGDDPWAGYIPDIESAARGGYGASDGTFVAVGTGERLLNEGLAQLYRLQGRLKSSPQRHLNQ